MITSEVPGSEHSIGDDGISWEVGGINNTIKEEVEWNLEYTFDNPSGVKVKAYKVIIDKISCFQDRTNLVFGLYDGIDFLPLNGGQDTVSILGCESPDVLELIPDQVPRQDQIEHIRQALYRPFSVEADTTYIDDIRVEIEYDYFCPCEKAPPTAGGTSISSQQVSLNELTTSMSTTDVNNIAFPTRLYRVKYYDGSVHNVLHQEMSIVEGGGTILQRLVINDANQLFEIEQNGTNTSVPFSTLLDIRRNETNIPINDPCSSIKNDPFDEPIEENPNPETPDMFFYVHDHLGNTRVLYHTEYDCESIEKSYILDHVVDYYPYGKVLREYVNGEEEKFLTTHHERDQESDLDYRGARFYDADIGRFLSLDPLAQEFPNVSPYNYVMANPVILIDPNGKSAVYIDGVRQDMTEHQHSKLGRYISGYFYYKSQQVSGGINIKTRKGKDVEVSNPIAKIAGTGSPAITRNEDELNEFVKLVKAAHNDNELRHDTRVITVELTGVATIAEFVTIGNGEIDSYVTEQKSRATDQPFVIMKALWDFWDSAGENARNNTGLFRTKISEGPITTSYPFILETIKSRLSQEGLTNIRIEFKIKEVVAPVTNHATEAFRLDWVTPDTKFNLSFTAKRNRA